MAAPHNPGGNAGKGRKKGSRNKRTVELKKILDEHGCDPVEEIVRLSKKTKSDALKLECMKVLLPYAYPRLSATQVNLATGPEAVRVAVELVHANGDGS